MDPEVLEAVPTETVSERCAEALARGEAYVHPGRRVSLITDGGEHLWAYVEEGGPVRGRESHFSTCPHASRHRR
jgi:hypothetical protein